MIILCLIIFSFFSFIDLFPLIKKRNWKDFSIYIILISVAFTLCIMNEAGIKIPSPAEPIKSIVENIVGI